MGSSTSQHPTIPAACRFCSATATAPSGPRATSLYGAFALVGTVPATGYTNPALAADTTYLYRVHAVDGSSKVGPASNVDLATTILFTDEPIVAGSTSIKAAHLTQLRTAVNAVRASAGLGAATFTNAIAPGVVISAIDLAELGTSLDPARSAIGMPAIVYFYPGPFGSGIIRAVHVQELRSGVK